MYFHYTLNPLPCPPCLKLKYPSGTLKIWTWTAHSCSHDINTVPHTHTCAATHICWVCRILHGWLPDNTDENLDRTKLPALMKTNYLDDSPVCWYAAGKFNSTRHCTTSTRSSSAGNTKLTVGVLLPSAIKVSSDTPTVCPQKVKGQSSSSVRRML